MNAHGGTQPSELARLGLTEADILDLSVNVSPFEIAAPIRAAIEQWDPRAYPDPECIEARSALADRFDVPTSQIILGNGATELIWTLFDAVKPKSVLILEPTFSEFRQAAQARNIPVRAAFDQEVVWPDLEGQTLQEQMVYLTHPNNPVGTLFDLDRVSDWASSHPSCWFVLDESFVSLSEGFEAINRRLPPNVLRLRSLTKDYGLAGLRVGYALCPAQVVRLATEIRPPWTVNGLAQAVVPAALASEPSLARIRERLFSAREHLASALNEAGFITRNSQTIYLLFQVESAQMVKEKLLLEHRIRVRDCTSFGLPDWVRVAAREGDATDRLVTALRALS